MAPSSSDLERVSKPLTGKSSTTEKCITFSDPQLRRGVRVSKVLRRFGTILENRAGSADTFALSRPVQTLNVFISHSWSTRRRPKFLALALHFNLRCALLSTMVGVSGSAALQALGILPSLEASSTKSYPWSTPYSTVLCYVVPMLALFWGQDLTALLELLGVRKAKHVFLDKACIHQSDAALQRQGIECLSAYLSVSDEMLIVYTSTYLKRLWTVYELASTLMIKQLPRITVVSTFHAQLLYVWWTNLFVFVLVQILVGTKAVHEAIGEPQDPLWDHVVWYGLLLPLWLPFMLHLRRWAWERHNMHVVARAFRIRSTVCCVDDDRKVVQRNITSFMRDFGFVPQTASMDDALDAFDLTAQKLVPLYLDASLGVVGLRYRHTAAMMLPLAGRGLDIVFANVREGFSARWYLAIFIYYCSMAFVLVPLWLALCMFVSSRCLELSKVREAAFIVTIVLLTVGTVALGDGASTWLYHLAVAAWSGTVVYVLTMVALGMLVACVYWPRHVSAAAHESCKTNAKRLVLANVVRTEI